MQSNTAGNNKKVAVIGAGVFGCCVAMAASKEGYDVTVFERLPDILLGTTDNNTNRVHQGFHYPRDVQTATECRDNYRRFELEFGDALLENYPNIYCIASQKSLTSKEDFIKFIDALGLVYTMTDFKSFNVDIRECNLGILCQETIIDASILRSILRSQLEQTKKITLFCGTEVTTIKKKSHQYELSFLPETVTAQVFDAVVNCSYANINTLTTQLEHEVREGQYEYTVVPIISLEIPPTSITVMDGPFMTLFPYGKTGNFLLYHVDHSVIKTEITKTLNPDWLDANKSPFSTMDQEKHFRKIVEACTPYVPALANAKLCGYLQSPRMVLPKHEQDDARPSFVNDYGNGYFTVFSGKIDRSLSIADVVCEKLRSYFSGK